MPSMSLTDVKKKKRNYSNLALKKCIHSTEKYFEKTSTRESFKRLQVLFTFLSDVKPKNKWKKLWKKKENKWALCLAKYDKMGSIKDMVWLVVEQLSRAR